MDVGLVLKMRLVNPEANDKLVWHFTKEWTFSVKTTYHMWMERTLLSSVGESSNPSWRRNLWRKVWSSKTQLRTRNFIWLACTGILPCLKNLLHRKVVDSACCSSCDGFEDEFHVLFHCREARRVWDLFPRFKNLGKSSPSLLEFCGHVVANCSAEEL